MTRDRVVDAAVELLNERDFADVSMQEVADRAGVAVRTVYRNFRTRDELLDGVVAAVNEHLTRAVGPFPGSPDDYVASSARTAAAALDLEPYYRALFATSAGRTAHHAKGVRRRDGLVALYADELAGAANVTARRFASLLHLVTSSNAVFFLKDYDELVDADIARTLQWAALVLTEAVRDPRLRDVLASVSGEEQP